MQVELDALVAKLEQLAERCAQLGARNHELEAAATRAEAERDAIASRLADAKTRLAALIDRLPEDTP